MPRSDARVELFLSESSNAGTPVNECFLNLGSSAMDELQKVQTSAVQDASPFPHDAYQIFLAESSCLWEVAVPSSGYA